MAPCPDPGYVSPTAPPRTFVVGATGFIGRHFLAAYREHDPDCLGSSRRRGPGLAPLDLADPNIAPLRLAEQGYRQALILAMETNYLRCERDPEGTRRTNVVGALEVARQLHAEGLFTVYFSSETVFDGLTGGYRDDSPPHPRFEYGRQKAEMERRLPEVCGGDHLIVRIGKTFGLAPGDGTLLDEMAGRLARGESLRVLQDQVFCPTLVADTVRIVLALQRRGTTGLLNLCVPETWGRLELAHALAAAMGVGGDLIEPISVADLHESFTRPLRTNMICTRLAREVDARFTPMAACLRTVAGHYRRAVVAGDDSADTAEGGRECPSRP